MIKRKGVFSFFFFGLLYIISPILLCSCIKLYIYIFTVILIQFSLTYMIWIKLFLRHFHDWWLWLYIFQIKFSIFFWIQFEVTLDITNIFHCYYVQSWNCRFFFNNVIIFIFLNEININISCFKIMYNTQKKVNSIQIFRNKTYFCIIFIKNCIIK